MKDKKIFTEEILNDEQLEKVSGGTFSETFNLVREIIKNNLDPEFSKIAESENFSFQDCKEEIISHLKKHYGVDAQIYTGYGDDFSFHQGEKNKYLFQGREVSHEQIMRLVRIIGA